jgi:hypothetical protein
MAVKSTLPGPGYGVYCWWRLVVATLGCCVKPFIPAGGAGGAGGGGL